MKPSGIMTLTTDFGQCDPYVAIMKGVILSINPTVRLVDISHRVGAGSIIQAAGFIRESFAYFPKGTIHLAVVDPGVGGLRRPIALETQDHCFVGPDNGLFWPVIEEFRGARVFHLTELRYFLSGVSDTFHGRDVFAPVAAYLSLGVALEKTGVQIDDPHPLDRPKTSENDGILSGQIMHVDHFGNLITNIHRDDLTRFLKGSQPVIEVGDMIIERFALTYSDSEEGQLLALINSSNWLEIAVNMGRASEWSWLDTEKAIGTVVKVTKM